MNDYGLWEELEKGITQLFNGTGRNNLVLYRYKQLIILISLSLSEGRVADCIQIDCK